MNIKNIEIYKKKILDNIGELQEMRELETLDIKDKIKELVTSKESIEIQFDEKIESLKSELDLLNEYLIVNSISIEMLDTFNIKGYIYNSFGVEIGEFKVPKEYCKVMHDSYVQFTNICGEIIDISKYIELRATFVTGVTVNRFKLIFNGNAYPVLVEYKSN